MIQVQATFSGFAGSPCSVFSMYDQAARMLVVGAEAQYRKDRRDGCVVITNDSSIDYNTLFSMDNLKDAIDAFFTLKTGVAGGGAASRLQFTERAARANPDSSIERDGIDATGPHYRVSDGITCGQMAVLATCLHATKADPIEGMLRMAKVFSRLNYGDILTI